MHRHRVMSGICIPDFFNGRNFAGVRSAAGSRYAYALLSRTFSYCSAKMRASSAVSCKSFFESFSREASAAISCHVLLGCAVSGDITDPLLSIERSYNTTAKKEVFDAVQKSPRIPVPRTRLSGGALVLAPGWEQRYAPLPAESVQVLHNQQNAAPPSLAAPHQQIIPYLHDPKISPLERDFFRHFRNLIFRIVMHHPATFRSPFLNKQLDANLLPSALPRIPPFG
jgi:hypothetical protein